MKYALVMVWLVNGQVAGQVIQEFDNDQAEYSCNFRRVHESMACIALPPAAPESKP